MPIILAGHRLAFRELGLAIGLRGARRVEEMARRDATRITDDVRRDLGLLETSIPMAEAIENFWSQPGHRQVASWLDHLEINNVMLATSLEPAEFLSVT